MNKELNNYLKNLNYSIQVEQMGLNSWGDFKKREPSKNIILSVDDLLGNKKDMINKQLARQQQIQLYLEKEKRPVVVRGVEYKYNSLPPPNLNNLQPIENEINNKQRNLNNSQTDLYLIRQEIDKTNKEIDKTVNQNKLIKKNILDLQNYINVAYLENIASLTNEGNKIKDEMYNNDVLIVKLTKEKNNFDTKKLEEELNGNKTEADKFEKLSNNISTDINNIVKENATKKIILDDIKIQIDGEKEKLKQAESDLNDSMTLKTQNESKTQNDIKYLKDLEAEITKNTAIIEQLEDEIKQSEQDLRQAEKENNEMSKTYGEELRRVNFGSFNPERQPGETDEQYIQRLETNSQVPFDNSIVKNLSDIERNEEFKNNLKLLFQNDAFIEKILNHFRTNDPEYIFIFNQYFNLFKEDYLKVYGQNNKAIMDDPTILIDLINNFCEAGPDDKPQLITPSQEIQQKRQNVILEPIMKKIEQISPTNYLMDLSYQDKLIEMTRLQQLQNPTIQEQQIYNVLNKNVQVIGDVMDKINEFNPLLTDNNTLLNLTNPTSGEEKYLKYLVEKKIDATKSDGTIKKNISKYPPTLLISNTGVAGSFEEKTNNQFVDDFLKGYLKLTDDEIRELLKTDKKSLKNLSGELILNFFNSVKLKPSTPQGVRLLNNNNNLVGMGLKNDIPETVQFGKYILLLKKLYLKNVLSLQKNNHQKIPGFSNKNVSNEFVNLIMKLLKKENLMPHDLSTLKIGERELLDNLLTMCELNKNIVTGTGADTLQKIKEQLKVIEGQIEAGNNNPILKDELYKTLFKLVNFGAITERQARAHYKNICNDFF